MMGRSFGIAITLLLLGTIPRVGGAADGSFVRLSYPDALLILDDEEESYRGEAVLPVEPGRHTLTLYPPPRDGQWLPPAVARPFELAEGESLIVREEAIHYLYVSSAPAGAEIRLNGSPAGTAPLALSIVAPIDSVLAAEKEGFLSRTLKIRELTPVGPRITISLDPVADRGGVARGESRGDVGLGLPQWLPGVTLAYFVASMAIGFQYKSDADAMYDAYLASSSVDRMNDFFERAETLDGRARLFWITGQAALATTVYFFIQNVRRQPEERPAPPIRIGLSPGKGGGVALSF